MKTAGAAPVLLLTAMAAGAAGCLGRPGPAGETGDRAAAAQGAGDAVTADQKLELARKLLDRQRADTATLAGWADRSLTAGVRPIFGPRSGELRPGKETGPALAAARIEATQVAVEARFRNPRGSSWSYGLGLRDAEGQDVRLYVNASAVWALDFGGDDGPPRPGPSGRAAAMDRAPGAANTLRLVAHGDGALLFVNGTYTAHLALPMPAKAGDAYLGSGFVEGDVGEPVRYEEWRVWALP
jgi:hypothetical protein